ncbi:MULTISPECIES: hypothetical protein [Vibrio]|uniref:hypothetical protein n=1 Tax=Vibrio TaxID=662 RepID=UPI00248FA524|nr:hypothetical protein [Vibrio parahaemolyticus]
MLEFILAVCTILGGITATWFLFEKQDLFANTFKFNRSLLIWVDEKGILDQDEKELIQKLSKASLFLSKKKSYELKVTSKKYQNQLAGQSEKGINKDIDEKMTAKYECTAQALKLLINMRYMKQLEDFTDDEFVMMAKGILSFSDLTPYNPFLDRLEVWFSQNHSFRETVPLSSFERSVLFEHLGIDSMLNIMPSSVVELPRELICDKVVPTMVYSIEKYSGEALCFHLEEQFNLASWQYGAA